MALETCVCSCTVWIKRREMMNIGSWPCFKTRLLRVEEGQQCTVTSNTSRFPTAARGRFAWIGGKTSSFSDQANEIQAVSMQISRKDSPFVIMIKTSYISAAELSWWPSAGWIMDSVCEQVTLCKHHRVRSSCHHPFSICPWFLRLSVVLKCFRRPLSQLDAAIPCPFVFQLTLQSELPCQIRADKLTVITPFPMSMNYVLSCGRQGFFFPTPLDLWNGSLPPIKAKATMFFIFSLVFRKICCL